MPDVLLICVCLYGKASEVLLNGFWILAILESQKRVKSVIFFQKIENLERGG